MASLLETHLKMFQVAGAAAGNITVSGVLAADKIVGVSAFGVTEGTPNTFSGILNLTSEFTVTADNTINNTSGTSTSGKLVTVLVERLIGKTPKSGLTGYR